MTGKVRRYIIGVAEMSGFEIYVGIYCSYAALVTISALLIAYKNAIYEAFKGEKVTSNNPGDVELSNVETTNSTLPGNSPMHNVMHDTSASKYLEEGSLDNDVVPVRRVSGIRRASFLSHAYFMMQFRMLKVFTELLVMCSYLSFFALFPDCCGHSDVRLPTAIALSGIGVAFSVCHLVSVPCIEYSWHGMQNVLSCLWSTVNLFSVLKLQHTSLAPLVLSMCNNYLGWSEYFWDISDGMISFSSLVDMFRGQGVPTRKTFRSAAIAILLPVLLLFQSVMCLLIVRLYYWKYKCLRYTDDYWQSSICVADNRVEANIAIDGGDNVQVCNSQAISMLNIGINATYFCEWFPQQWDSN